MLIAAGCACLLTAVVLRLYAWHGYHLSTLHALCSSWLGQWGQAASSSVASRCTLVGAGEEAAGWSLILGVVLLGVGGVLAYLGRDEPYEPLTPRMKK